MPRRSILGEAKDTNKPRTKTCLLAFCRARVSWAQAKDTKSRAQKQTEGLIMPRRSILGEAKDTNKPRTKTCLLAFCRARVSWAKPKIRISQEQKPACLHFAEREYLGLAPKIRKVKRRSQPQDQRSTCDRSAHASFILRARLQESPTGKNSSCARKCSGSSPTRPCGKRAARPAVPPAVSPRR